MVGYLLSRSPRQLYVEPISSGASKTEFQNQSGLLAAVTAQLIVFFKADGTFDQKDDPRKGPILTLTYVALILSIGATIGSLLLTNEYAYIPINAARSPDHDKTEEDMVFIGHHSSLLRVFGLQKSAVFLLGHCESCSQPRVRS